MRDEITTLKIAKLPAWVRALISSLEGAKVLAERKLQQYLDSQKPSKIYLWEPSANRQVFIQTDRIYFELAEGRRVSVALHDSGDHLVVMSHGFGGLSIHPHVCNVVAVHLTP